MFSYRALARVRKTESFSADLTLVDLFGETLAAPVPVSLDSVNERLVKLNVAGLDGAQVSQGQNSLEEDYFGNTWYPD